MYDQLAQSHPSLSRGRVWCRTCGATRPVDSAECLQHGWPKCCGATMTIDSPCQQALQRARDILDELRAMLPDHAAAIDALAAKLEASKTR
jgi:hypothetical protein